MNTRRWMRNGILAMTIALGCVGATNVGAQPEDLDVRTPKLKEGQLFTVKLVPAGKEMQIFFAGHKQAEVKMSELGLQAYVRGSGGQMRSVTATNRGTYFTVPASEGSELRLKVDYQGKQEEYQFPLK